MPEIREHHAKPSHKLEVVTATLGMIRIDVAMAQAKAIFPMGIAKIAGAIVGKTTCEARNLAVKQAFDDDADYLMFWDDDILPHDIMAPSKMMNVIMNEPKVSVIGGAYPRKIPLAEPIVFYDRGQTPWWGWQDGRVHEVFMSGTGFMIIRMADIMQIEVESTKVDGVEVPELFKAIVEPGLSMTDDFYFAELCHRAKKRWFVHGGVVCSQVAPDGYKYTIGPPPQTQLVEKPVSVWEQVPELVKEEANG
jgi:hypothetical protein